MTRAGLVGDAAGRHRCGHAGEYNFADRVTCLASVTEGPGIFNRLDPTGLLLFQTLNKLVSQSAGIAGQAMTLSRRDGQLVN